MHLPSAFLQVIEGASRTQLFDNGHELTITIRRPGVDQAVAYDLEATAPIFEGSTRVKGVSPAGLYSATKDLTALGPAGVNREQKRLILKRAGWDVISARNPDDASKWTIINSDGDIASGRAVVTILNHLLTKIPQHTVY